MYPATEGLTQLRLRMLIGQALGEPGSIAVRDWLPAEVQRSLHLPALRDALELLHRPPREQDHTAAAHRPSSGAAPSRLRGAAGASVESAAAQAAHGGGSRVCR